MKNLFHFLICFVLAGVLLCGVSAVQAKADWTVLLYLCGTDLESEHENASSYLAEMAETQPNASVNLVVETGGAKKWHSQKHLGFQISNTTLQRYHYGENGYTKVGELPSASMGDPDTLTDFIRWGTAAYPAEKYMLVLWDHGDGINMLFDEIYMDRMQSYEIGEAMQAAGTQFEVFLVDACLMSTLETASAVSPNAHYMIASQEVTIGLDAAFTEWMQYLYDAPYVDGALLGHYVCDTTQTKLNYNYSGKMLTWAVTDLTKIDAVKAAFADFVKEMVLLLQDVQMYRYFDYYTNKVDNYGSVNSMYDLGYFAERAKNAGISNETIVNLTNAIMNAVIYQVKGYNRVNAHGLSFFYDRTADPAQLDEYAKNCPVPEYLAFLDAINPYWDYDTGSVSYDEVDPAQYEIQTQVSCPENGAHFQLNVTNGKDAVSTVDYDLYQYNRKAGKLIYLGRNYDINADYKTGVFTDRWDGIWAGYNGLNFEMIQVEKTASQTLYDVPVIVYKSEDEYNPAKKITADDISYLRIGHNHGTSHNKIQDSYRIDGIWNERFSLQDPVELKEFQGQYMSVVWKIYDVNSENNTGFTYAQSKPFEITENFQIQKNRLSDGTYYCVYVIKDVFDRSIWADDVIAECENGKTTFRNPHTSTGGQTPEKSIPLSSEKFYFFD